jgi:glutathione peroxidase-family protein
MSMIWICDVCNSKTRHLSDLGIIPENQILCRPCYENTLEDIDCNGNLHTLCQNMKCKKCYNKSLASIEKIFNLDFASVQQLGLKTPRLTCKSTHKKYPFICDFGHKWNVGLNQLARGRWCSNSHCKKMKLRKTCIERFGVEYSAQSDEIKKKSRKTCMERYGVAYPTQVNEFRKKSQQTCMKRYGVKYPLLADKMKAKSRKTCMEKYGVEYSMQAKGVQKKSQATCMKRYGVKFVSQSKEITERGKRTCLEKYGVEFSFQSKKVREKGKQTFMKKYGVENPSQANEIKEKIKRTCMEKYGVEFVLRSRDVRKKIKKTCMEKYGVEVPTQSDEIKEKIKKTCMKKYGVRSPMQCPEIFFKNLKSAFCRKEYQFPSGRKTQVQGYEHIVLNLLLQSHKEDDIQTSFENHLKIDYYVNDKKHAYYPDIFVTSENLIIEVKSDFTYNKHRDINELKARACIDNGYRFQFYIIDGSKSVDIQERV